jgi:exonuclease SbcD
MKLLHTSDWHLGQSLMKVSRETEHRLFIDHLVKTVRDEAIDTLIVAGDIFDTTTPASYARELYLDALRQLKLAGLCNLILVAGNHDSVAVLEESRTLLTLLNIHVVAAPPVNLEEAVFDLLDAQGAVIGLFCAVPFLRLRDLLDSLPGQDSLDREDRLRDAISDYYHAIYQVALQRRNGRRIPLVASGHLTTVGGQLTESVRDIYIGSLQGFPGEAFPPFDYVALGHLHRAQTVGRNERLRYSGAPLPMSFDEAGQQKYLVKVTFVVDETASLPDSAVTRWLAPTGSLASTYGVGVTVSELPIPVFQKLQTLKGSQGDLLRQCGELALGGESVWLNLEVQGEESILLFKQQLERVLDDSALSVLCLRRVRVNTVAGITRQQDELLQHLNPEEVFQRRLDHADLEEDDCLVLKKLYCELLAEVSLAAADMDSSNGADTDSGKGADTVVVTATATATGTNQE